MMYRLSLLVIILLCSNFVYSQEGKPILYGDVNEDGIVNIADVELVNRRILKHSNVILNEIAADLNKDGIIDVSDISLIINTIINNRREKPKVLLYKCDTKAESNHIVNAVVYPNGVIIAARPGSIVKIEQDGTETTLLTIRGSGDWRGIFMDENLNVYVSPHASAGSSGGFQMIDRGLYRLAYGENTFVKVISLYNPESLNPNERLENDDTIWTMCQDDEGYLYAGVYCHTKRWSPRIYRSSDGGNTWVDYYDFLDIIPQGHHVHSIIYNQYNRALYCIVGEKNTVLKSKDHGTTWVNLNVKCELAKGSSMIAVDDGILIGSDGAYDCQISKLYSDDKTIRTVANFWANTVFAIRKSDLTGWLYAFTKIDSSVNSLSYMPPISALDDKASLEEWIASTPRYLVEWQRYNKKMEKVFPEDAIRPQHCGIFVSKDKGETWDILHREYVGSYGASGYWTTGYFRNGECLTGFFKRTNKWEVMNPHVISEGKHNITDDGVKLESDNFIRTNWTNLVDNNILLELK